MQNNPFNGLKISKETIPLIAQFGEGIPGGFFIYQAYDTQEIIYFNSHMRTLFGCKTPEEFRILTNNSFRGIVHPDDYDLAERSIWEQIRNSDNNMEHISYRNLKKDGSSAVLDDYGHFIQSKDFGDIFCVFVQDITSRYNEELEHRETNARMMALEDTFEALIDVNLKDDTYDINVVGSNIKEIGRVIINNNAFFTDMMRNAETIVYPEDREEFLLKLSRRYIEKTLEKENHFDFYFRFMLDDKPLWFRSRVLYQTSEKQNLIVGLFNAQEEMEAKQEEERFRRELVDRMTDEEGVFLIDCKKNTRKTIHNQSSSAHAYSDEEKYTDSFYRYVHTCVAEADREMLEEAGSPEKMLESVKDAKECRVEFRDTTNGIQRFYEMRICYFSETEVLQCFTENDKEIIDRLMFSKLEKDYFALFAVDLDSGLLQVTKNESDFPAEVGEIRPYDSMLRDIGSKFNGEVKEYFDRISNAAYMKKRFMDDEKATYLFKDNVSKETKWVNSVGLVLARDRAGVPSLMAIGFSYLDSAASEKAELQERIRESMDVVGGLASEYTALYHVNLDSGAYVAYHLSGDTAGEINASANRNEDFADLAKNCSNGSWVHPDDREKLAEFYPSNEGVRCALEGKKKLSLLFKQKYGEEYLWTEANIIKCEDTEKTAHNIIVGLIEKDEEVKRGIQERRQKQEAEETRKIVEGYISAYNIVYIANLNDDSIEVRKMDSDMLESKEHFGSFSDMRKFTLEKVIHPRSREQMQEQLNYDTIRKRLSTEDSYTVEYSILKDAATKWGEMTVTSTGGNRIIIGMTESDLEVAKRRIEGKRYEEYFALYVVDLDTEMVRTVKPTELFELGEVGEAVAYKPHMKMFAAAHEPKEKEFFMKLVDLDYVRKDFSKDDKRTYSYKSKNLTEDRWVDVTGYIIERNPDGSPAMLSIGFSYSDALATSRQELQIRLNEDMQMIGGLASGYHALYYFNIERNIFEIYSIDGQRVPELSPIVSKGGDPLAVFHKFGISNLVHPEDKHLFAELDAASVLKKLAHKKKFSTRFRRNFNGEYLWTEMDVIKYEDIDEPANAIAIGFAERDAEIRSEQALASCLNVLCEDIRPTTAIDRLLATAVEFYGADRCYVFEYDKNGASIRNVYEWLAQGIHTGIPALKNLPREEYAWWIEKLRNEDVFYSDNLEDGECYSSDEGRNVMKYNSVQNLMAIPIRNGNEVVACVSLDNPKRAKKNQTVLKNVAAVVYSEILRINEYGDKKN